VLVSQQIEAGLMMIEEMMSERACDQQQNYGHQSPYDPLLLQTMIRMMQLLLLILLQLLLLLMQAVQPRHRQGLLIAVRDGGAAS